MPQSMLIKLSSRVSHLKCITKDSIVQIKIGDNRFGKYFCVLSRFGQFYWSFSIFFGFDISYIYVIIIDIFIIHGII